VISPIVSIDLGRAPELAHPHHKCGVEETALLQVIQEGSISLLHRRDEPVLEAVEVVLVGVPRDAGTVDRGDKARASLHQTPRKQV